MYKHILLLLLLLYPVALLPQDNEHDDSKTEVTGKTKSAALYQVQPQYTNQFKIKNIYFNKIIQPNRKGELLEVEMTLINLTDDPMDLYVFVISTFEKAEKRKSSFDMPIPPKDRIRNFVPFPDDIKNFQYPDKDIQGKIKKDRFGKNILKFIKFPHNPKAGVNPSTGKPYNLKEELVIRTYHMSKYRTNYVYFNEAAVLVFNSEGNPLFRQLYQLKGYRR